MLPALGAQELARLSPADIRGWHAQLVRTMPSGSVVPAKTYRLLRAILATAVGDEVLARNPCLIRGAGVEAAPERPVATPNQVWEAAELVPPRFRVLVLIAGFMGLRLGELLGLQRRDLLLHDRLLVVDRQLLDLDDASLLLTDPKTEAGRRTLAIPGPLLPELQQHLDRWTDQDEEAFVFTGANGGPVRRRSWSVKWRSAAARSSLPPGFRFHDLRHTANTLAAATPGVSTKDLMYRLGHSSPRAALLYQHATARQDARIAEAIAEVAAQATFAHSHSKGAGTARTRSKTPRKSDQAGP